MLSVRTGESNPTKLGQTTIFENRWIRLVKKEYRLPDSRSVEDYFTIERRDFVVIVPRTIEREFVLVRQFRHGVEQNILGFPMGLVDGAESAEQAAERELREETGHIAGTLVDCGIFVLAPQILSSTFRVFLASDCMDNSKKSALNEEILTIERFSAEDIQAMIVRNELHDAASLCAWAAMRSVRDTT